MVSSDIALYRAIKNTKYWPATRVSTDHSGLECASAFELDFVYLIVFLSANIFIFLNILLCSPLLWNSKKFTVMNPKKSWLE